MRALVLTLGLLSLSACIPSKPDNATSEESNAMLPVGEVPSDNSVAIMGPALIPAAYLGTFDVTADACAGQAGPSRLSVEPTLIRLGDSIATATSVTGSPGGVQVDATLQTVGVSAPAQYLLSNTPDGKLAVATGGTTSIRVRCAGVAAKPKLMLGVSGEGLELIDPQTGQTRHFAFGTAQDQAIKVATAARGAPTRQGSNQDCGEGSLDYADFVGITLSFQGGKLVGWTVKRGKPPITTVGGLGLGTNRQELQDVYGNAQIDEDSSLGVEFSAGGVSGVLDSNAPNARVTNLWAGATCIAR